jgi:hypothetical protein
LRKKEKKEKEKRMEAERATVRLPFLFVDGSHDTTVDIHPEIVIDVPLIS